MGHGIAQVLAAAGRTVDLYEPDLARANAGRERIVANLERAVAKGRLDATSRVEILDRIAATDRIAAAAEADLVVEAIFEDEVAKRSALGRARRGSRRGAPSSPPTPARSRSTASRRRWPRPAGRPSAGCTSSARSR